MYGKTIRAAVYGLPAPEIEGICQSLSTPGFLIKRTATGTYATADAGTKINLVAVENIWSINLKFSPVDTPYQAGDRIYVAQMRPGDVFVLRTKVGETIAIGDPLEASNFGMVVPSAWTAAKAGIIIGTSMENIALTTAIGSIKVKIV
jgi:hypothetical protein